ncbi:MAG: hypothetical protein ACE5NG_14445, partial [bacterium]
FSTISQGKGYNKVTYVLLVLLFASSTLLSVDAATTNVDLLTLSLSAKAADIRDILRGIAIQNHINIVPDNDVMGSVTIHLENAPFEEGLRTLLETNGFVLEKKDSIYLVHKKESEKPEFIVNVADDKLTLDVTDADVRQVLREIAKQGKVNIVMEPNLTGKVTAHLADVPIETGLEAFLIANDFLVHQDDGVYRVFAMENQQRTSFFVFFSKGKFTIDVKAAPLDKIFQEIATQAKLNLVTVGALQGNLTLRLTDVDLDTAMKYITAAAGYEYKVEDGIYLVGDPRIRPGQSNPLLEQKVIWLKHIEAQELMNSLPADIPKQHITLSQDRNALVVLGTAEMFQKLDHLLAEVDIENADIRSRQPSALSVEVDTEGLISIDAKDADMEMVIRELSIRTGIDVVIMEAFGESTVARRVARQRTKTQEATRAPQQPVRQPRSGFSRRGLIGNVNLRIEKATLSEIFDALFSGTSYTYKKEKSGNKEFYIIGTGTLLQGQSNPLTVSKKIPLNYLDVTRINELLPPTIPDANITVIKEQNAIAVIGTSEMIAFLEEYLHKIDSPTPQVLIEAILLELTSGSTRDLGIEWGATKGKSVLEVAEGVGFVFDSLEKVPSTFDASLSALLAENKARILASPRVATLNGETAIIDVGVQYLFQTTTEVYAGGFQTTAEVSKEGAQGQETPYYSSPGGFVRRSFNTIDTGITLDITPWVGNTGEITMKISPQIRDADMISAEESRIADRTIDTTIRIPDGGMIVIGGLLQEKELTQKDKVPVLGSIPLLGRLFSTSHKVANQSELIIIITPKLISGHNDKGGNDVSK